MEILKAMLIPGGIMLAIALVFGVLLVFLSGKLAVKRDPRVDEVENLLAKSNCGGCGRAGCAAFAEALVAGEAKLSDCNSTSGENKAKIAELLGVDAGSGEETIAVVRCAGGTACKDKYEYQGYGDCASMNQLSGGKKACPAGCMGMGSCVDACAFYAMDVGENGCAQTDREKCTSCGMCIKDCPKGLIERIPKRAKVYVACKNPAKGKEVREVCTAGCIACGLCAKVCPHGAIEMSDGLPVIDYARCVGCGVCAEKCPTKVIKKL